MQVVSRVDQRALSLFIIVERIVEHRTARAVLMAEVSGSPWFVWIDGVKIALGSRRKTGCILLNRPPALAWLFDWCSWEVDYSGKL